MANIYDLHVHNKFEFYEFRATNEMYLKCSKRSVCLKKKHVTYVAFAGNEKYSKTIHWQYYYVRRPIGEMNYGKTNIRVCRFNFRAFATLNFFFFSTRRVNTCYDNIWLYVFLPTCSEEYSGSEKKKKNTYIYE